MSSSRESVGSVGNGAIVAGLALAFVAWPCFENSLYYCYHVKPKIIEGVESVAISDLRSLLDSSTTGRLFFVRGIVEAKSAINGCFSKDSDDYFLSLSGARAVVMRRTLLKYFSKDLKDLFLPVSDLGNRVKEFHKEQYWMPFKKAPFILVEGGQKPSSDYIAVNMDVFSSSDPYFLRDLIPLETAYRMYELISPTIRDILRPGEHGYPVCQWVQDEILPIGQHISAVGMCRHENGVPVISHCKDLHFFLTDCRSKEELVEKISSRSNLLFDLGILFGSLGLGFFIFAAVRKWDAWKQRSRN